MGLLTRFLHLEDDTVAFILIGAVTMNTIQIAQLDLSYALLYSVWSKSLKHEFIAPVRLSHILIGSGLVGLVRGFLVFVVMGFLSVYFFDMDLGRPGLAGLIRLPPGDVPQRRHHRGPGPGPGAALRPAGRSGGLGLFLPHAAVVRPLLSRQRVAPRVSRSWRSSFPLTYFLDYFRHFYGFPLASPHPLLYGFGQSVIYLFLSYGLVSLTLQLRLQAGHAAADCRIKCQTGTG